MALCPAPTEWKFWRKRSEGLDRSPARDRQQRRDGTRIPESVKLSDSGPHDAALFSEVDRKLETDPQN